MLLCRTQGTPMLPKYVWSSSARPLAPRIRVAQRTTLQCNRFHALLKCNWMPTSYARCVQCLVPASNAEAKCQWSQRKIRIPEAHNIFDVMRAFQGTSRTCFQQALHLKDVKWLPKHVGNNPIICIYTYYYHCHDATMLVCGMKFTFKEHV